MNLGKVILPSNPRLWRDDGHPMKYLQLFDCLGSHLPPPYPTMLPTLPPAHSHSLSLTHLYSICLRENTHPHGVWICARWHCLQVTQYVHSRWLPISICRPPWARPEVRWPFHIQFFLWATSVILFTCFQPKLKQKPNVRVRERRNPGLRDAEWTDGLRVSLAFRPQCCGLQPCQALSAPDAQCGLSAQSLSRVDSLKPRWL